VDEGPPFEARSEVAMRPRASYTSGHRHAPVVCEKRRCGESNEKQSVARGARR